MAINRITRLAGTPRQAQVYINTYLEGLYGFSRRVTSICNRSIYFSTQPIFSLLPLPFNPSQSSPSATFLSRVPSLSSFFFFSSFFSIFGSIAAAVSNWQKLTPLKKNCGPNCESTRGSCCTGACSIFASFEKQGWAEERRKKN